MNAELQSQTDLLLKALTSIDQGLSINAILLVAVIVLLAAIFVTLIVKK